MNKQPLEKNIINKKEHLFFNLVKKDNKLLHIFIDDKGEEHELENILRYINANKYEYKTREEFYKNRFSQYYENINYEDFITLYYVDFGIELPYMLNEKIFLTKKEMIESGKTYDYVCFEDIEWLLNSLGNNPQKSKNGELNGYSKEYITETDTFIYSFDFYVGGCYIKTEEVELKEDLTNSRILYEMGEKISKEKNIKDKAVTPQPYWND